MGSEMCIRDRHATAIGAGDDYVPMLVDHIAKLNGINIQDEVIKGEDDT